MDLRLTAVLGLAAALLALGAPGAGASVRTGGEGSDTLTGGASGDVLAGHGGPDDLFGAGGRDVLAGGEGSDQLLGGSGRDVLSAGAGADQVHADDGSPDVVSCGTGSDTVFADRVDTVSAGCERDGRERLRGGALATFDVVGERFRAWTTSPATMWQLATPGREHRANIPSGRLVRGPGRGGPNRPYSWHLAPDFEMGEMAIEACDAVPSYVEEHVEELIETIGSYCPWGARLVERRNYTGRALERPPEPPDTGGGPVEFPDGGIP